MMSVVLYSLEPQVFCNPVSLEFMAALAINKQVNNKAGLLDERHIFFFEPSRFFLNYKNNTCMQNFY